MRLPVVTGRHCQEHWKEFCCFVTLLRHVFAFQYTEGLKLWKWSSSLTSIERPRQDFLCACKASTFCWGWKESSHCFHFWSPTRARMAKPKAGIQAFSVSVIKHSQKQLKEERVCLDFQLRRDRVYATPCQGRHSGGMLLVTFSSISRGQRENRKRGKAPWHLGETGSREQLPWGFY